MFASLNSWMRNICIKRFWFFFACACVFLYFYSICECQKMRINSDVYFNVDLNTLNGLLAACHEIKPESENGWCVIEHSNYMLYIQAKLIGAREESQNTTARAGRLSSEIFNSSDSCVCVPKARKDDEQRHQPPKMRVPSHFDDEHTSVFATSLECHSSYDSNSVLLLFGLHILNSKNGNVWKPSEWNRIWSVCQQSLACIGVCVWVSQRAPSRGIQMKSIHIHVIQCIQSHIEMAADMLWFQSHNYISMRIK